MMHQKMAPAFEKGHVPHNKGKKMPPPANVPKAPPVQGLQPQPAPVAQNDATQNYDWIGANSNSARTVTANNKPFSMPSTKKQPR